VLVVCLDVFHLKPHQKKSRHDQAPSIIVTIGCSAVVNSGRYSFASTATRRRHYKSVLHSHCENGIARTVNKQTISTRYLPFARPTPPFLPRSAPGRPPACRRTDPLKVSRLTSPERRNSRLHALLHGTFISSSATASYLVLFVPVRTRTPTVLTAPLLRHLYLQPNPPNKKPRLLSPGRRPSRLRHLRVLAAGLQGRTRSQVSAGLCGLRGACAESAAEE